MIICIGFMSLLFTFKGARVQALSSEYKLTSLILEMMINDYKFNKNNDNDIDGNSCDDNNDYGNDNQTMNAQITLHIRRILDLSF